MTKDLLNLEGGQGNDANPTNTPDPTGANPNTGAAGDNTNSGDPGATTDNGKNTNNFGDNWREFIPEEVKDRSEWNNIKDVSDLFKNYISSQQYISKSVRIPDETSSPEDIASFYSKLGKPQSKTDYTFEYTPKDNYIYNKDSFDFTMFQEIADKANLTAKQYEALATAYIDVNNENYIKYNQELATKAAQELKDAEASLRSTWGQQYTQNINSISDKVKKLYSEDTIKRMQNAGLFRDPAFLETHLKLTKMMTGDTVFLEGNAVENVPQTLQTLQEKRDKLMAEDYTKNRDQVLALNNQIVKLKQSQTSGVSKFLG